MNINIKLSSIVSETTNSIYKIANNNLGIKNTGNSCYINVNLQVILHTEIFIYYFLKKIKQNIVSQYSISYKLFEICKLILNLIEGKVTYLDISNFIYFFKIKYIEFGNQQNDSQEFCRVLLEDIITELNENSKKIKYKELQYTNSNNKLLTEKEFKDNFKKREDSIIIDIFYSEIISKFTCMCNYVTYSFQKYLDIPLLIPENKRTFNIEEL